MYRHTCMHAMTVSEREAMHLKWGEVYGKAWWEEKEGRDVIIIISKLNQKVSLEDGSAVYSVCS